MYLPDTNIVSELRRARPRDAVLSWLQRIADADLHVSVTVIGDIQAGVEITRERDKAKAQRSRLGSSKC